MSVAIIVKVALVAWLLVLAAAVLVMALNGRIRMGGLLASRADGGALGERGALAAVTVGVAFYLLIKGITTDDPASLPDVPDELLLILGGSKVGYLSGKMFRHQGRSPG